MNPKLCEWMIDCFLNTKEGTKLSKCGSALDTTTHPCHGTWTLSGEINRGKEFPKQSGSKVEITVHQLADLMEIHCLHHLWPHLSCQVHIKEMLRHMIILERTDHKLMNLLLHLTIESAVTASAVWKSIRVEQEMVILKLLTVETTPISMDRLLWVGR